MMMTRRYFARGLFLVLAVVLSAVSPATLRAAGQEDRLKEAKRLLLRGNYAEARGLFEKLLGNEATRNAAVTGISRSWRLVGEYDKALKVLERALTETPNVAPILEEKADLLFFLGRWEQARETAAAAIQQHEESYLAHWVLARLYRDTGNLEKADRELLWFIRNYVSHERRREPITDPDALLVIGEAAVERARKDRRLSDQFQFVLTHVWGFAAKKHPDYWPAVFARGRLFMEKSDYAAATRAFNKALAINPRAAQVLTAKGRFALERFRMEEARLYADQALRINPHLPDALLLTGDYYLAVDDAARALQWIAKAKAVNPRSEPTLAAEAFCRFLQRRDDDFRAIVASARKQNPKCGVFYLELADRLDRSKRYPQAEAYYRKAVSVRPKLVAARGALGMLYLRLGREAEAKKLLDEAFRQDPFNVRVYNSRRVLRHLADYQDLKTPHFIVRYDPKNDALLARFIAHYLEKAYEEFAAKFDYRPPGPILFEILNNHEMFSGRVIALPDLHTIGASTGKIIAMCSPRDRKRIITAPFNWNRVLRHELVHVFNLEQTNFTCPHWFTEGLAVRAEGTRMPPDWYRILLKRVPAGDLMTLDDVHLGFIRPGSSEEWQLAYLQSKLYVDFMIERYGRKAIAGMLRAYRDGLSTGAAIERTCGVSKEEFEKGYRKYLDALVRKITGRPAEKPVPFTTLKERVAKNPNDADAAAMLADRYLALGSRKKALELADKALSIKRKHPLAGYVKAAALAADRKDKDAIALLTSVLDRKEPNLKVVKLLGGLHFAAKDFAPAAEIYELGRRVEPYDNYWLAQLVRCYRQTGEKDKLIGVLEDFVAADFDELDARVLLAEMLAQKKDFPKAERYAREAMEIDVNNSTAQQLLIDALRAQDKNDELKALQKLLSDE